MSEVRVDYESGDEDLSQLVYALVDNQEEAERLIEYIEGTYSPLIAKRALTEFLVVLESHVAEVGEEE